MHILTVQLIMLLIADRVLFKKTNKQKKKAKIQFSVLFSLHFQQKSAPKFSSFHLLMKSCFSF